MNNKTFGFIRVAAATPRLRVADPQYNVSQMVEQAKQAYSRSVAVLCFPEAGITAYTCGDLFLQDLLLQGAEEALTRFCLETSDLQIVSIVGLPLRVQGKLFNVAAVVSGGRVWGFVPKTFIPNYNEFYDKRWFSSACELFCTSVMFNGEVVPIGTNLLFSVNGCRFAIEICEDVWTPIPPSSHHALQGAELIFNLSASPETAGKSAYRKELISQQSARCIAGYVYASAGVGESTTDLVFAGHSLVAENGSILGESERFLAESQLLVADVDVERLHADRRKNTSFSATDTSYIHIELPPAEMKNWTLHRTFSQKPFVPRCDEHLNERCNEIFNIQVAGLMKRLLHTGIKHCVIGVSGGLDSTLALLVTVAAFRRLGLPCEGIVGITMPGFGTTHRTKNNATLLMEALGIQSRQIVIEKAVNQHFEDIGHNPALHDVTYENSQARERTQILMDYANRINGLVIGTGDLSELALGWCTYNGDHMSMYAVNVGVPKTLISTLVTWYANEQAGEQVRSVLLDVVNTPISPELLPADDKGEIAQITEDVVGPYLLHDFFLYHVLRFGFSPSKIYFLACHTFADEFSNKVIIRWMKVFFRRFFSQQFKRSCLPDGVKVGSVNLSPRGDWRMPSDASAALWMRQLEELEKEMY